MYKLDGPIKWDPLVIVGEPNETVVIVVLTVGQLLWSDWLKIAEKSFEGAEMEHLLKLQIYLHLLVAATPIRAKVLPSAQWE